MGIFVKRLTFEKVIADFRLLVERKNPLKGNGVEDVKDIKRNATRQPLAVSKTDVKECFRKWEDRWKKVIACEGEYFKGIIVSIDQDYLTLPLQYKIGYFPGTSRALVPFSYCYIYINLHFISMFAGLILKHRRTLYPVRGTLYPLYSISFPVFINILTIFKGVATKTRANKRSR